MSALTEDEKWRLNRVEEKVIGTADKDYQDGLVQWRLNLDGQFKSIKRLVHIYGGALVAGFLASGILSGKAGEVAAAVAKAFGV